jgi:REP element-mobilizing transposase RayT
MLYKNKFRVESTRLPEYDYSTGGWYFVTINTLNHMLFFGDIQNDKMILNESGHIVEAEWLATPNIRKNVSLDEYVIMPNHVHGIICIEGGKDPNMNKSIKSLSQNLSSIINGFKSAATSKIRRHGVVDFAWQSRFYDRIIRNKIELYIIRRYIEQNPLRWHLDNDIPENIC